MEQMPPLWPHYLCLQPTSWENNEIKIHKQCSYLLKRVYKINLQSCQRFLIMLFRDIKKVNMYICMKLCYHSKYF